MNRRKFLKTSASLSAAFTIIPRHVLGGTGFTSPSDELTRAVIGVGGMGRWHARLETTRLLAICDVDKNHLKRTIEMLGKEVPTYHDFREVLQRKDIDIIHIATPPHWHGLMSAMAAEAGKDIWCEKPMTRTIGEGKKVVEAVQRNSVIFRINTWFRFQNDFYRFGMPIADVKKAVANGLLGWPLKVTIGKHQGFEWKFYWSGKTSYDPQWIPEELDYNLWLGPAPYKPYNAHRVHATFRGYWDYDGGGLGDMAQHYLDPVQYILDKDNTSPIEIHVDAPQAHTDAVGTWQRVNLRYADGCEIILDGENKEENSPFIEGPEGKIFPQLRSDIPNLKQKLAELPDPEPQVTDFIEAVKKRQKFALNEENGHQSATLVNLSKIAIRLGRTLRFDPVTQQFIGDEAANRLIDQPMRAPWVMP
ncbi:MAG: gfo/Idh/MocA family oxidoreductase [Calditrichaeota bacterium]|nr:MAG: gfo/Idh/MocA family oxidoreductase [Calditrichota bacterium]